MQKDIDPELAPLNVLSPQASEGQTVRSPERTGQPPVQIQMTPQQGMPNQQMMMQPHMVPGPGQQGMMYGPGPGPQNPRIHPMGPGFGAPMGPGQQFMQPGGQPGYPGRPGFPPQQIAPYNPQQGPGFGQQRFPTVSRFEGDNKGLQNVSENGPSTYESYQVCSAKCSSFMGTYMNCLGCWTNPYQQVPEGYSGMITRFGKFYKLVGPGLHYLLPELDTLVLIDKREKVVQLKQQNVVTMDNATLIIDAVLYYKIKNSYKSKFAAVNLSESINDLSITTLRNIVGRMTVQMFLERQDHLAESIEAEISHVADTWGVKVTRLQVQDVYLPQQFRNTFSTGAVAKRISEAQVINSKAEVQVAKLLKEASDALNTEAAFQIRYIDALENIAKSNNPKMIFFPADYKDVGAANTDLL